MSLARVSRAWLLRVVDICRVPIKILQKSLFFLISIPHKCTTLCYNVNTLIIIIIIFIDNKEKKTFFFFVQIVSSFLQWRYNNIVKFLASNSAHNARGDNMKNRICSIWPEYNVVLYYILAQLCVLDYSANIYT